MVCVITLAATRAETQRPATGAPRRTASIAEADDLRGAWRMRDGGLVALHRVDGSDSGWRFVDFRNGASHRLYPDAEGRYTSSDAWTGATPVRHRYVVRRRATLPSTLTITSMGAPTRVGTLVPVREDTATFMSDGVPLFGKLVRPAGPGPWPVVVFVHGSERSSAVDQRYEPYLLAAHGIAMFVYDKRGSGRSKGADTQRFSVLAGDVVAAARWLRTQPGIDTTHMGLAGFSQGGWVAPLAASRDAGIHFVLVGYGMTMSVADEDRIESPMKLREMGFGDGDIREFEDLNAALHRTAAQRFTPGWVEVEAKLALYRDRRWLAAVRGMETWAGTMLAMGMDQAKVAIPAAFSTYFEPFYDPLPTLEALDIPMFWLLAADDLEAPPARTIADLTQLRAHGKRIEFRIFPNTDHGITEYTASAGARRERTRYAPTYFPAMIAWLTTQARRPR